MCFRYYYVMRNTKLNNGFTLVELLVSVAIVGILAGMAVMNLSEFKSKVYAVERDLTIANIRTAFEAGDQGELELGFDVRRRVYKNFWHSEWIGAAGGSYEAMIPGYVRGNESDPYFYINIYESNPNVGAPWYHRHIELNDCRDGTRMNVGIRKTNGEVVKSSFYWAAADAGC